MDTMNEATERICGAPVCDVCDRLMQWADDDGQRGGGAWFCDHPSYRALTARLTVLAGALDAIAALAPRLTNDPWAVLKEIESTARAALGAAR